MTEIPEHLIRRAQLARDKAAAESNPDAASPLKVVSWDQDATEDSAEQTEVTVLYQKATEAFKKDFEPKQGWFRRFCRDLYDEGKNDPLVWVGTFILLCVAAGVIGAAVWGFIYHPLITGICTGVVLFVGGTMITLALIGRHEYRKR